MSQQPPTPDPVDEPAPGMPGSSGAPDPDAPLPPPPEPAPTSEPTRPADPGKDPLRGSRTSGLWAGMIALAVLLILLIIFIAQNTETAGVRFLGLEGSAPQAVLLLIAAVVGMAVVGLAGALRILQLRRRVRHERKVEKKRRSAT